MEWYNLLGVALQVAGVLGAMYLLGRLHEEVTGRQVLLLHPVQTVRAVRGWLRVRVLRRAPPAGYVDARTAQVKVGPGRAHGVAPPVAMPDGLALPDQVAWVSDYVRGVESKVNDLSTVVWRQAGAQDDAVKAVRDDAKKQIREAVEDVRSEVRKLSGSNVGWEIASLFVVVVGVVLTEWPLW
jgi:tetrahydromethanopterin S-methyltransferase subunit G